MVAVAVAFGETRRKWRKRGTEGFWGVIMVASTTLLCPPYSVLSESNECNDLNAVAVAFGETRRKWRKRGMEGFWGVIMVASTTLLCPP